MSSKSEDTKGEAAAQAEEPTKNKNKRNRKDKPWDNDTIDHWHVEPVTEENGLEPPLEESTFATLFPKYREAYIREVWPLVTKTLKKYGINCELNLIDGSMSVSTTRKTWDPYSIIKARDLIKLLSRSIPVEQALKILDDSMQCDIIKIKGLVRNKDRFAKRRGRLIGPNGCTLKAIELVTDCYVMVQGNTVAAMGTHKKLEQVRRIVLACMKNIHPIYIIRELMIRKELEKDPALKNESWDRFLPKIKKKNVQRRTPHVVNEKVKDPNATPFPAAPTPRKVDLEMASGAYWLKRPLDKDDKNGTAGKDAAGAGAGADSGDGMTDNERRKAREEERAERQAAKENAFKAPEEKTQRELLKEAAAVKATSLSSSSSSSSSMGDADDDDEEEEQDAKKAKKSKKSKASKAADDEVKEKSKKPSLSGSITAPAISFQGSVPVTKKQSKKEWEEEQEAKKDKKDKKDKKSKREDDDEAEERVGKGSVKRRRSQEDDDEAEEEEDNPKLSSTTTSSSSASRGGVVMKAGSDIAALKAKLHKASSSMDKKVSAKDYFRG